MPKARFRNQRCTATVRSGARCCRYCADGEVVCAKHLPNAQKHGVVAAQDTDDLSVLLQRLTKDRDPSIRLRAIEARLKWEERRTATCPACDRRAASDALVPALLAALTDDERDHLTTLLADFRAFKLAVYRRRPDVRPDDFAMPDEPVSAPVAPAKVAAPDAEPDDDAPVTIRRQVDGRVITETLTRDDLARWSAL